MTATQTATATTNLPAERKPGRAEQIVMGMKPEISKTLPKHIDPDAFSRTVQTAIMVQPDLLDTTPKSLFVACMKAATDGLIIDGREAALVIRRVNVGTRDDPQWEKQSIYQPMVQGLMKLARNSGQIESITAQVVYKNDEFSFNPSIDVVPNHAPDWFGDRGAAIGAYAVVKLKGGDTIVEIMSAKEIMNIGSQGQNAYQYDPLKGKNFGEWWRKTAIRRITKYIPRSSDAIGRFIAGAEAIDADFDFYADEPPPPAQPVKKRGSGAAALANVAPTDDAPQQEPQQQPEPIDHDPETGEVYDMQAQQPGDDI